MANISEVLSLGCFLGTEKEHTIYYGEEGKHTLYSEREYVIPAYQRNIKWKDSNAIRLINDLIEDTTFLGTILLSYQGDKKYDIIDGQQRITVFRMIMKSLDVHYGKNRHLNKLMTCSFSNKSFEYLDDLIECDFLEEKFSPKSKISFKELLDHNDDLSQYDDYKKLWQGLNEYISKLDKNDLKRLYDHLLKSEVNVLISLGERPEEDVDICVNYYLNVNDKAVPLDNIDKLKGYLFKLDYENMTNRWIELQKNIKRLKTEMKIEYPLNSFFEQYFLCTINRYFEGKVKDVKGFKFVKDIEIGSHLYKEGTHILEPLKEPEYGETVFNDMNNFISFIFDLFSAAGPTKKFKERFNTIDSKEPVKDITIKTAFYAIKKVLTNDDVVPKALIMKYFFEYLNEKPYQKKEYEVIFDIFLLAVGFSACESSKEISKIRKILLINSSNLKTNIEKKAYSYLEGFWKKSKMTKELTFEGIVSTTSGEVFSRQVAAIMSSYRICDRVKKNYTYNIEKLNEYCLEASINVEHFLVNEKYKYTVEYGEADKNGKRKNVSFECPNQIQRIVSYLCNFILLDKEFNRSIGNRVIWEKIQEIQKKPRTEFCDYTLKITDVASKIFVAPVDFEKVDTKEEAKEIAEKYYNEEFGNRFLEYVQAIRLIEL